MSPNCVLASFICFEKETNGGPKSTQGKKTARHYFCNILKTCFQNSPLNFQQIILRRIPGSTLAASTLIILFVEKCWKFQNSTFLEYSSIRQWNLQNNWLFNRHVCCSKLILYIIHGCTIGSHTCTWVIEFWVCRILSLSM